jgi:hypothetical protein
MADSNVKIVESAMSGNSPTLSNTEVTESRRAFDATNRSDDHWFVIDPNSNDALSLQGEAQFVDVLRDASDLMPGESRPRTDASLIEIVGSQFLDDIRNRTENLDHCVVRS